MPVICHKPPEFNKQNTTTYTEPEICHTTIGLVPICVCAIKMVPGHETKAPLDDGESPAVFRT